MIGRATHVQAYCPECDRMFYLNDHADADEYYWHHDCEVSLDAMTHIYKPDEREAQND